MILSEQRKFGTCRNDVKLNTDFLKERLVFARCGGFRIFGFTYFISNTLLFPTTWFIRGPSRSTRSKLWQSADTRVSVLQYPVNHVERHSRKWELVELQLIAGYWVHVSGNRKQRSDRTGTVYLHATSYDTLCKSTSNPQEER